MIPSAKPGMLIPILLTLSSCLGLKGTQQKVLHDKSYCNQQVTFNYTEKELPTPTYKLEIDPLLKERLSFQSLKTANAIGLVDLLTQYVGSLSSYGKNPTLVEKINIIDLSVKINQTINNSSLEVSAVASKLDCEEERAAQFAYYLKEKEDNTENKLIIGSIIIAAAGAIAEEATADTP
ncbi:MAG TPA: hypothetical protein PKC10_06260, partial [Cyclobacteriaceae bacterium]|nr:hypothetical protein [Cyclobacteriaceae bacterium]